MSKTTAITQESGIKYLMNELECSETKEDFVLDFWMFWAQSVTVNTREFQKVIANAAVNRWFLMELNKEEKEFSALASLYPEITGKDKDLLYIKCIYKLFSRFPMSLLQQAKKRDQKPQTTKVAGRKIELSIINQN